MPGAENSLERDQAIALAVAELIAFARGGGEVEIVAIPERDDRTNPAVELVTADSVGRLAIEHTLIEPYSGQIGDSHQVRPYAEALPGMLAGRLPADSRFDLNLDVGAVNGVRPASAAFEAIAEWVVAETPSLVDGRPGVDGRHTARGGPPDLPFPITLVRWPRSADSVIPNVTVGWWRPEDLEERRRERLGVALRRKLPKLMAATAQGCDGVLVVESADIQLSNAIDIRRALRDAASEADEALPAWIVLWEQSGDGAFVSILRADDVWIDSPRPWQLPAIAPVR